MFAEKTVILQNWTQGIKNSIKEDSWFDVKGTYRFIANTNTEVKVFSLDLKEAGVAQFISKDTLTGKYSYDGNLVKLSYTEGRGPNAKETILSGVVTGKTWTGRGSDALGNTFNWSATFDKKPEPKPDSVRPKQPLVLGKVTYPFLSYGWEEILKPENILIKNATVWTSEKEGNLKIQMCW